ncbi:hypothetical protein FH972_007037 [Carpinus fangiana]|uniref:non-specific serine/threonine protein kinase n=1 Tax=Carpinus fangiana TaxID=176857 RepID=A0A5N6QXN1_9ROSI|nr:hypothetical protein FH972_007037 [Carpinus fangiana]
MPIAEDNESCGSRSAQSPQSQTPWQQRQKQEVYSEVLRRIQELNREEANLLGFDDQLWLHFNRLPARYALDVNVERAEDVLTHKRLLELAEDPANRPAFEVRLVQVYPIANGNSVDSVYSDSSMKEDAQSSFNNPSKQGIHPPPTFGSSPNLEALALEANGNSVEDGGSAMSVTPSFPRPMHEITFAMVDKPKLLNQLTLLLSEIGLNIREAHAFSTVDGFSLDVFVVDGWHYEETEELKGALEKEILMSKEQYWSKELSVSAVGKHNPARTETVSNAIEIPTDGIDVWEIDTRQLTIGEKVGSGSFGDLYKGTYFCQEVAIKFLKPERVNKEMLKEFSQEVYIMRKVRHKNVVQFIGACTLPPNLCIVTEFMSRGSIYDFLHKQRSLFKLPSLLKVAIDISKGMNYLHQNNIIHRDLKTANLLMDENEVRLFHECAHVKVIEHKAYDHKADIFSFGIVLWELLTRELPYSRLTPLQAAVGVVQKGLRPTIPKNTNPRLAELLERCWQQDAAQRPDFFEIIEVLQRIADEVRNEGVDGRRERSYGGFFSALRKGHH